MRLGLTKQVLREVWPDEAPICLPHETPMFREAKPHETSSWLPHETPVLREARCFVRDQQGYERAGAQRRAIVVMGLKKPFADAGGVIMAFNRSSGLHVGDACRFTV